MSDRNSALCALTPSCYPWSSLSSHALQCRCPHAACLVQPCGKVNDWRTTFAGSQRPGNTNASHHGLGWTSSSTHHPAAASLTPQPRLHEQCTATTQVAGAREQQRGHPLGLWCVAHLPHTHVIRRHRPLCITQAAAELPFGVDPRTRWWGVTGCFSEAGSARLLGSRRAGAGLR